MAQDWTVEEVGGQTRVSGSAVTLYTPYTAEFIRQLSKRRPGIDLLDELLRSEHPPYIQDRLALLFEPFEDRAQWRVLDFGCGAGASAVVLARLGIRNIVGIDLVNEYAALWRQRLREAGFPNIGTFVQSGQGFKMPFADGSFDAILLNGVLEHLLPEERSSLLLEAARLLREGGYLFIAETPNQLFPRNSHTKLWFSEWLPWQLAAQVAARWGHRTDFPEVGRTAQFRTGFRGMSFGQIHRILRGLAVPVVVDDRLAELEFTLPRNPLDASARRTRLGALLFRGLKALCHLSGQPVGHIAPHLNVVFKKRIAD